MDAIRQIVYPAIMSYLCPPSKVAFFLNSYILYHKESDKSRHFLRNEGIILCVARRSLRKEKGAKKDEGT